MKTDYLSFSPTGFDPLASGITIFNPAAMPLFEQARQRATLLKFFSTITGKSRDLRMLNVNHVPAKHGDESAFAAQVATRQIKGSVNRSKDFDCDFYPLNDALADRWVRIASMMLQGLSILPVDLIVVDGVYYVIDGHHRISVCRALGQTYIDAIMHLTLQ